MIAKFLCWMVATIAAAVSLVSLTHWVGPRRAGMAEAGGMELVYALDPASAPKGGAPDELAQRMIAILKRRVDPDGQRHIEWHVIDGPRILIRVPYASPQARLARAASVQAYAALRESCWKQSEIEAATGRAAHGATPEERPAILEAFLTSRVSMPADSAGRRQVEEGKKVARDRLRALTDARQRLDAAKSKLEGIDPTKWQAQDIQARLDAQTEYNEALKGALDLSVDSNFLSRLMAAADSAENVDSQKELAALPDRYPLQKDKILAFVAAHQFERRLNGGTDEVEDLQALIGRAGVLDFRIAVLPGEIGADLNEAVRSLSQLGPEQQVRAHGTTARWFEVDPNGKDNLTRGGYVITYWATQPYILLYDDHDHMLTHADPRRKPWAITAHSPYNDPASGGLLLPFSLDPMGASYMGDLTGSHVGHPLAILLDDRVMSAPNIHSRINDSGVITFGMPTVSHPAGEILREALQIRRIMDAGALPAVLEREPIRVTEVAPIPGYRPFPWFALCTLAPLPVMALALWLALRRGSAVVAPAEART